MTLMAARTLSISIECPPREVYEFILDPENLPKWARGFARSVTSSPDGWIVETSDGPMGVAFADRNQFGVADHAVTVKPGLEILNPVRVLANGDGSEVLFTLFRLPDVSEDAFAKDVALVSADLQTLKALLEG